MNWKHMKTAVHGPRLQADLTEHDKQVSIDALKLLGGIAESAALFLHEGHSSAARPRVCQEDIPITPTP